jgi:hypothetical protein
VENIRGVTEKVILAVGRQALAEGVCDGKARLDFHADDVSENLQNLLWYPEYVPYIDATWEN